MKKIIGFIFIFMLVLISCDNTISVTFDMDEFNTQRAAWEASGMKNYSYVHYSVSDANPSLYLNVDVSGDNAKVTEKYTGKRWTLYPEEYTIDRLYNSILHLYNEYNGMKKPACEVYAYYDDIEVTYDKDLHIPIKIYAMSKFGNETTCNGIVGFWPYHVEVQNFQVK
ncbi:MAG: hypothetical protein J6W76_04860 [Spirochaetales bacterium]|nr:hypothetical protein [Spirochaetales bacterium]